MPYKAALFDLDGTILDTLDDLTEATNTCLKQFHMPTRTKAEVRRFVGNGIRTLIERAAPPETSADTIDRMFAFFLSYYKDHCAIQTKPYPEISDVIQTLRASGIKTAVISNKADAAVQSLCADYFPNLFDCTVGERASQRRKPCPDSVLAVIAELALTTADVVYIGDSEVDVQTAQNAGVDAILVSWGFRDEAELRAAGASCVIHTPSALLPLILS